MYMSSVLVNAVLYVVACWGSSLRVADANRLNRLIWKASDVVGLEFDSLEVVSERRMLSKLSSILDNDSHPLNNVLVRHRSTFSQRLIPPKCTTWNHSCLWPSDFLTHPSETTVQTALFLRNIRLAGAHTCCYTAAVHDYTIYIIIYTIYIIMVFCTWLYCCCIWLQLILFYFISVI